MFFVQVEKLCKQFNTTPTAVTLELGYSKGSMSHWKKGNSPSGEIVVRFANYFGVTTDYLLTGKEYNDEKENEGMKKYPKIWVSDYSIVDKALNFYFTKAVNNQIIIKPFADKVGIGIERLVALQYHQNNEVPLLNELYKMLGVFSAAVIMSEEYQSIFAPLIKLLQKHELYEAHFAIEPNADMADTSHEYVTKDYFDKILSEKLDAFKTDVLNLIKDALELEENLEEDPRISEATN